MPTAIPNRRAFASLVNGLPTCTFPPTAYTRNILSILVKNTVASQVNVYIGSLSSTPVASNLLGANNTLRGPIRVPAAQPFFVQWTAAGSPVSGATANVQLEEVDNPLDPIGGDGAVWDTTAITTFRVPTTGASYIDIGSEVPAELATWAAGLGITITALQRFVMQETVFYTWEAVAFPNNRKYGGTWDNVNGVYVTDTTFVSVGGVHNLEGANANPFTYAKTFEKTSINLATGSDLRYNFISLSRGWNTRVVSLVNTGLIGAETAVLTTAFTLFQAGRAYEVIGQCQTLNAVSTDVAAFNIRRTNVGGAILLGNIATSMPNVNVAENTSFRDIICNYTGGDIVQALCLTMISVVGANLVQLGGATIPRSLEVRDVGPATLYPSAPQI